MDNMAKWVSAFWQLIENYDKKHPGFYKKLWRFLFGVFLFFCAWALFGCSPKERVVKETVYQDVYIPAPCNVDKPLRPAFCNEPVKNTLNILKYTEELEKALNACIDFREVK